MLESLDDVDSQANKNINMYTNNMDLTKNEPFQLFVFSVLCLWHYAQWLPRVTQKISSLHVKYRYSQLVGFSLHLRLTAMH